MSKHTTKDWKRRAVVLAVTAALGGSALLGAVAPASAFAAPGDAEVTIHPADGNTNTSYQAYRLFTAVIDDNSTAAREAAWDDSVSVEARGAIVAKLNELTSGEYGKWVKDKGDDSLPQNVLEFMSMKIAGSDKELDGNGNAMVNSATFAMDLATWLVKESGIKPVGTAESGTPFSSTEGYYLFVTSADADMLVATSPIWFPLGGNASEVYEKASAPMVDMTIGGAEVGEGHIGENLQFEIAATLPGNYNSYGSYAMTIETDPVNLAVIEDSVHVYSRSSARAAGTEITNENGVEITMGTKGLVVKVEDLKKADPQANAATKVVVEYGARLTRDAAAAPGSNLDTATYTFSNDPVRSDSTASVKDASVKVHTFQLDLAKKDKHTHIALEGAKFIIKNGDGDYYDAVSRTWTLDEGAAKKSPLATDKNGALPIYGLDAGTYTITEVEAPEHYVLPAGGVTLVVTSGYEGDSIKSLGIDAEGGILSAVEADKPVASADTGVIAVTVVNDKNISLAMTGAEGVGLAGAGVVAIGLVWYAVRSRRDRADQQ